jgi:hypothetical protein
MKGKNNCLKYSTKSRSWKTSAQVSTQALKEAQLVACKMGFIQAHLKPRDLLGFITKTIRILLSFWFSKTPA